MKTRSLLSAVMAVTSALTCAVAWPALATDTNSVATAASTSATSYKLPYGADDVLKLSQAQISEDIILNYVQSSGTIYNLTPPDIVYLRNGGVSDKVVNAMLDQRKKATEAAAQVAPQNAAPMPVAPVVEPEAYPPPVAPVYSEPVVTETAPAPSTLYVIPYPAARAAFYGAYSYYRPYGYYGGPYYGGVYYPSPYYRSYCGQSVSFGVSVGGRGHYYRHH